MKLYGYLLFFALFSYTSAKYQQDDSDLQQELKTILRHLDNDDDFTDQLHDNQQDSRSVLESFSDTKRRSETPTVPLLNVTVIQRGLYLVRVKINFLRNGLQDEYETDSIVDGSNKVFPLQQKASDVITYVRVRFHVSVSDTMFGDFQIVDPKGQRLCFVLSGTMFSPVYSICAPNEDYSRK